MATDGVFFLDGTRDGRYTVAKEWIGESDPRWVTRFQYKWIGARETEADAWQLGTDHKAKSDGRGVVPSKLPEYGVLFHLTMHENGLSFGHVDTRGSGGGIGHVFEKDGKFTAHYSNDDPPLGEYDSMDKAMWALVKNYVNTRDFIKAL